MGNLSKVGIDIMSAVNEARRIIPAVETDAKKVLTKTPVCSPKTAKISTPKDSFHSSTKKNVKSGIFKRRAAKFKTKFFTPKEILDMKPSSFKKVMISRNDIPEAIRGFIKTPEMLNLYDEVINLNAVQKMEIEKKEKFLNKLFGQYSSKLNESAAQLKVIPKLIKKGYDPQMLADLPICEHNKDIVEAVLKRKDLPEKYARSFVSKIGENNLWRYGGETYLDRLHDEAYQQILRYADKNNFQYIDECLELTGGIRNLPYWQKDTSKILKNFSPDLEIKPQFENELLDRLFRNGHSYESVKAIFGDKKMTKVTQRLLEYKNFDKFKDIGIGEFDKLSITDKKEFIKGYISALTPKELLFPSQHNLATGMEELKNSMKIYKNLNTETTEAAVKSYYNILRSLLNKLPEGERNVIRSTIDTKFYRRRYRLDNPIPSLVDELSDVLKIKKRTVNGKTIKYAEMNKDVKFGISTHRFPKDAILSIEALEDVDPNMLLCVGTKGGNMGLNVDSKGYSLIVKPRQAFDWHVQAYGDIDSGNNVMKNIYNFEHIMLPGVGNHCSSLDLVQNTIKKELNLSQREYTKRMRALKKCRTLGEIGRIDPSMEKTIRKVIKEQNMYEGLIRPETMGITIPQSMPLEEISEDIINYCIRRDIPLVRVVEK